MLSRPWACSLKAMELLVPSVIDAILTTPPRVNPEPNPKTGLMPLETIAPFCCWSDADGLEMIEAHSP